MQKSLIIARLVGPVLSAIGIGMLVNQPSYREMAVQFRRRPSLHLFFRNSGAGRRALHPQCPQCVDTRLAQRGNGRWVVPHLRRHVPDHCTAVFQLCRRRNRRQQWIFRRRGHRSARAWGLHYVQRLHGI